MFVLVLGLSFLGEGIEAWVSGGEAAPRQTDPIGTGLMAWWISLILLSMAVLLWKKSCDSMDDVIALLERILATTLVMVVVLVSRNLLLEAAVLIAAIQLPGVPRRPR